MAFAEYTPGPDEMYFYNNLTNSLHRDRSRLNTPSQHRTPLGTLERRQPMTPSSAHPGTPNHAYPGTPTHRATPVTVQDFRLTYNPPTPWQDNQGYSHTPAETHPDLRYGYSEGYPSYPHDPDCPGKYSTGSGDSGVHSNSPAPATDFSDHQMSPIANNHREQFDSSMSLNRQNKQVKNETYV